MGETMKHRDLIIAAMDGKPIQWSYPPGQTWHTFQSISAAVACMAVHKDAYTFRIKSGPVPDKVWYGVVQKDATLELLERFWRPSVTAGDATILKVTVKTDENGVKTQTVEIVK